MQEADIPGVVALEKACFVIPWTRKDVEAECTDKEYSKSYVVFEQEQIIGYAIVWELYEQAELVRIGMDPAFRKQGFSKACLLKAMKQARSRGCVSMSLEVQVSHASAIHLYLSCGFRIVHTSRKHYDGGEDAYVMVSDL